MAVLMEIKADDAVVTQRLTRMVGKSRGLKRPMEKFGRWWLKETKRRLRASIKNKKRSTGTLEKSLRLVVDSFSVKIVSDDPALKWKMMGGTVKGPAIPLQDNLIDVPPSEYPGELTVNYPVWKQTGKIILVPKGQKDPKLYLVPKSATFQPKRKDRFIAVRRWTEIEKLKQILNQHFGFTR